MSKNNDELKPVILSACRTPGGKFGGSLQRLSAPELGSVVLKEALQRSGVEAPEIAEIIMGNGWQAGIGANPARIAGWKTGSLKDVSAFTINKRCGSGLRAVMLIADRIRLGDINVGMAGGMESASNVPYILPEARWGHRMGEKSVQDLLHKDGFFCPLSEMMMGTTAEILAEEYSISRKEQDSFALRSHRRASAAVEEGVFRDEIVPVHIASRKAAFDFEADEIPRKDTTEEKLSELPPIFKEDGTVTAGSSSALCDGAAAMVVASSRWAKEKGYKPLCEILSYATAVVPPDHMGIGPVEAVPKALKLAGLSLSDVDLIELNEAFAVQVLAVQKDLGFDMDLCNIHGGAIALGHPIGATGAKILTTLLYALRHEDKEIGLATACIGGGQGVAMVIKRF
ncbi:MAG: thiolase family protein [Spirochaetales bacterium]|nr:thiolase family protein [Spirochaetales bacterium]